MKCIKLNLFIIIFIFQFLGACSTHNPAPVSDRSYGKPSVQKIPSSKTHIVKPGETLFSIASRYGLTYQQIASINRIPPPYTIHVSQKIHLGGVAYSAPSKQQAGKVNNSQVAKKTPVKPTPARKEKATPKPVAQPTKAADATKIPWRWPSQGPVVARFTGSKGLNQGIDIGGKLGEPVMAAAAGQVVYAGSGLRGYGMLLIVKHSDVFLSAYAHNDRLRVKEGDSVKAGQVIADMGSSGTDRVKLHFEIRRSGVPVDPLQYLPRR